jgi:hypothetical protein
VRILVVRLIEQGGNRGCEGIAHLRIAVAPREKRGVRNRVHRALVVAHELSDECHASALSLLIPAYKLIEHVARVNLEQPVHQVVVLKGGLGQT